MSDKFGSTLLCRITSLRGFSGVIIGRDLSGVLTNGHVYSAERIMDQIILTDLGEHAVDEWLEGKNGVLTGTLTHYAMSGTTKLTKDEFMLKNSMK